MNNNGSRSNKDPYSGSNANGPQVPPQTGPKGSPSESDTSYTQGNFAKNAGNGSESGKKSSDDFNDPMKNSFRNFRDSGMYQYATSNKIKTITYLLLVLGIILIFFNNFIGTLFVGFVAGYHFSDAIVRFIQNLPQLINFDDQVQGVVMAAVALTLFIVAPGLPIGAVIVAVFKELLFKRSSPDIK